MVLNSLSDPKTKLSDPEIINECISVQDEYRNFVNRNGFLKPSRVHNGLVDEYFMRLDEVNLCVRVYNTAWVSQLHEEPGKMSFPRACMTEDEEWARGELNIAVLHHPTHWMLPNRKRLMSQHLDRTADLVMYGHEHLPEQYIKSDFEGNQSGVFYGGVFQESIHDVPGQFNIISYDNNKCEYCLNSYERAKNGFQRTPHRESWIPIPRLLKARGGRFEMKEAFLEWLADADVDFSHPSGQKISLDNLYVLPDFDEIVDDDFNARSPRLVGGERIIQEVIDTGKVIVYGDERSGKTALSKYIFLQLMAKNVTPVFIDSKNIGISGIKELRKTISRAFNENYETGTFDTYDSLPKNEKALIVDNFHQIGLNSAGRVRFLEMLAESFDAIVCFGDRLMFLDEISDGVLVDRKAGGFSRYRVREMGRFSRRRLIRQWYSLGVEFSERGEVINQRVARAETVINSLFGKSFLPRLPVFVLGFLSNIDAVQQNKDIGTYGYIYESSITNSLVRGGSKIQMDIKYRYLAKIAYRMHSLQRTLISIDELKLLYSEFASEIGRNPGYENIFSEVVTPGVLVFYDGELRFEYDFAYYFFIARYFRDNLSKEIVREELKFLAESLHVEKNSNIWLFLVHQSKDEFLLECVLDVSRKVFSKSVPARLEEDIDFVRDIHVELAEFVSVPNKSTEETIKKLYDSADERDGKRENIQSNSADDLEGEASDFIKEVESMIRIVGVLGQLVKNFPALDAEQKKALVENAFSASLRTLSAVMEQIKTGEEGLTKAIADKIIDRNGDLARSDVESAVKASIFWIYEANVFGLIRLVSSSVGAVGEESTFREVVTKIDSKAAKLIGISIGLDTLKLPRSEVFSLKDQLKGDTFNSHILRGLVANHLYLFSVPQAVHDEFCQKLNIVVGETEKQERALGYRHGRK